MRKITPRDRRLIAVLASSAVLATTLSACTGTTGTTDKPSATNGEPVTLTLLLDPSDNSVRSTESLIAAFNVKHPNITINVESRAGGPDGANVVKTRIATGDMTDIFDFNSGASLSTINPDKTLLDVTDEPFVGRLSDEFIDSVSVDGHTYGAPLGSSQAGGVLYNKSVYKDLGLSVPKTWDDFIANSKKIKAAGKVAVIESYATLWTSQLLILGDLRNILADNPDWADQYTANKIKYATDPLALEGFEHIQEVFDGKFMNENFGSATLDDGMALLASGDGVQYPILTSALATLEANYPEALDNVGFFPIPGDDPSLDGTTVWMPLAFFINKETKHPEEAKLFLDFVSSVDGCDAITSAVSPAGPYLVDGCDLPADSAQAALDVQTLVNGPDTVAALEFVSPVKGPNLANLAIAVGSGINSAKDGAAQYDEDVKKQAQQLSLPGW